PGRARGLLPGRGRGERPPRRRGGGAGRLGRPRARAPGQCAAGPRTSPGRTRSSRVGGAVVNRHRLTVALLAVCLLVVAACGQKSGVHVASGGGGGTGGTGGTGGDQSLGTTGGGGTTGGEA